MSEGAIQSDRRPSPWWPKTRAGQILLVAWLALNLGANWWFGNRAGGVVAAVLWYVTIAGMRALMYPSKIRSVRR